MNLKTSEKGKKEKKGGAVSAILIKLGLTGSAGGGAASAGGASISTLGSAKAGIGFLASKSTAVGLLIASTGLAAGLAMLKTDNTGRRTVAGQSVFLAEIEKAEGDSMAQAGAQAVAEGAAVSGDGVSDSLSYLNKANQGVVMDPANAAEEGDEVAGADAPADEEAVDSGVGVPDNSYGSESDGGGKVARGPRGKLKKSKKSFKGKSSNSSNVTLVASANLPSGGRTGRGGVKRTARSAGARAKSGARRTSSIKAGNSALNQAMNVRGAHKAYGRSGKNLSSANVGTDYDGGRAGAIGGAANHIGGGRGMESAGVSRSRFKPNRSLNTRELPQPKKLGANQSNVTPYQATIQRAMMAMLAAGLLLAVAGMMKKSAKANPFMHLVVKAVAAMAAMAAGVAIMAGLELMNQHGQQMQGMMFAGMGAIILFQAGMVIYDDFAAETADKETAAAANAARIETLGKLDAGNMSANQVTEYRGLLTDLPKGDLTPNQVTWLEANPAPVAS